MQEVLPILFLTAGLAVTGCLLALHWIHPFSNGAICRFLRDGRVNFILFSAGSFWFLIQIAGLGEADFGQYKSFLFVFFLVLYIYCFKFNYGFLGVRGLSILFLVWSNEMLNGLLSARYDAISILLKIYIYFIILSSLYLAAFPYRLRDFLLNRHEKD